MNITDLGKKFIVEVSSTTLTVEESKQIADLQPAGFMFRKRNFLQDTTYQTWLKEYQHLVQELRSLIKHHQPILAIDHEGGLIIRPPAPITRFPYPFYWQEKIEQVSYAIAVELKSLAINLNFSPVADIHSNPANPVINDRAFACTAPDVIDRILPFIRIMNEVGIACCPKHFPGHGNTNADSHLDLPSLNLSLSELEACELQTFTAAIQAGIPAIMPGHLSFPKIDSEDFVTFSKIFLHDLLRSQLGFQGVTIADAFSMAPAKAQLAKPEMVWKACNAGLDIFSIVGPGLEITDAIEVRDQIAFGLQAQQVSSSELQASLARIDTLLSSLQNFEVDKLSEETLQEHQKLAMQLTPKQEDRLANIIVTK